MRLDGKDPITPKRVYLRDLANNELIPLYPFFFFDNDTHLLYSYSELSNKQKLVLKCPYQVPGASTVLHLDLDPSVVVGVTPGGTDTAAKEEQATLSSSQKESPTKSGESIQPDKDVTIEEAPSTSSKQTIEPDIEIHETITINPLADLEKALRKAPVMGQFHPLVSLCLSNDVETNSEPKILLEELDSLTPHVERPVLVTRLDSKLAYRFTIMDYPACPPADVITQNLPFHISEARQKLITSHSIADRIFVDVREQKYQTVILLLVDGLSYADVMDWPEQPEPCFIDGPTITFSRSSDGKIDTEVGFPAIIGSPSLSRRLIDVGLPRSRGFSYWERAQNDVSKRLFQGIPLEKVNELAESFDKLKKIDLHGMFVQMVREGLDGLAHNRREVGQQEIKSTVDAIHQDFHRLCGLLNEKKLHGAIYLVADHGILWKNQHKWQIVDTNSSKHPRYATNNSDISEFTTEFVTNQQKFQLWHYPYLGKKIKANDSGVHGGLSYWESIVPFVRVEVNQ